MEDINTDNGKQKSAGDTYMFRYACFDMLTQRNLTEQDASSNASDLTVMYMTERMAYANLRSEHDSCARHVDLF